MAYKSYPFAYGSIKAKEKKLLSKERMMRISELKTADDALRALAETGYSLGDAGAADFERLIKREIKQAYEYVMKVMPDAYTLDLFLIRADYHNLKVLLKLTMKKEPLASSAFKDNGTIPLEVLKAAVADKKYERIPEEMKKALIALDRQFSVKEDVSLIGLYLDTAYAEQVVCIVKGVREGFIREYIAAYADITNVISFLRLRLLSMGREMLKKVFIKGGRIKEELLFELYEAALEAVPHAFGKLDCSRVLNKAFEEFKRSGSLYTFEKARDDYLLDIVKAHSNDVFSVAPSIAYLLAKEREADNIRLVMTAKLNGKDADFVADRIKEMFS